MEGQKGSRLVLSQTPSKLLIVAMRFRFGEYLPTVQIWVKDQHYETLVVKANKQNKKVKQLIVEVIEREAMK